MQIDIIDDIETLRRHEENWRAVYDIDPDAQYFMSWPWISNWLDLINDPWFVLAAKTDATSSDYVAFFPLQLWTDSRPETGFSNSLRMGGHQLAGYTGVLCDPAHDEAVMPAFAASAERFHWTSLYLERLVMSKRRLELFLDSLSAPAFDITANVPVPEGEATDNAVYPYVELPGDWETYLSTHLGKTTRKNARRCIRLLESGELRMTHADAGTWDRDVDTLLRFWEIKWAPTKPEEQIRFLMKHHRSMLDACFKDGTVLLPILWQGDKPIGARVRLIDWKNRALICYLGSRDLTVKKPPPGFIVHLYSIRWAIENGFKTYDLQVGNHPYKYDFGVKERRPENRLVRTKSNANLRGQLEPRSLPVVLALAHAHASAGAFDIATVGCKQILEAKPGHPGATGLLKAIEASAPSATAEALDQVRDLAQQGKTEEAARVLDAILKAEPRNFDARYLLGLICLRQNQFETAERHIRQAIAINTRVAPAHFNHGLALRGLGRMPKALKSFKKAIALRPDYAAAIKNRDQVAREMKRRS